MRELPAFFAELGSWAAERDRPAQRHAYGPHPDQHAELRLPDGEGPHRVVVVIHGGFWRAEYTKANTTAVAVALAAAGWATWNVEYRRVGSGGGYPETLDDVAAARAALHHVGAALDLDAVGSLGHSAGGHLALWLAAEGRVSSAVALAGVCDLAAGAAAGLGDDAVAGFLGGAPDAHGDADPARRLPLGVPLLLVHGSEDDRVPAGHSRAFAAAARAAGDDCRLLELDGVGHFEPIDPRSSAWPEIVAALAALT
ncbi:MAG TPA: alpha/beta hydrolase [Gaiellaceae bacterium]|nr:alpha/beta hydrolase [Gaiellaceae bacterium]